MVDRIKQKFLNLEIQNKPNIEEQKKPFMDPRLPGIASYFRPFQKKISAKNEKKGEPAPAPIIIQAIKPFISYDSGSSIHARSIIIDTALISNSY